MIMATPAQDSRFDELLMALASQHQGVLPLLRTFFSFLHRRTDVYVVDNNPKRTMGFVEGDAEKLVLAAFRSFPYKDPSGRSLTAASSQAPKVTSSGAASTEQTASRQPKAADKAAAATAPKAEQQQPVVKQVSPAVATAAPAATSTASAASTSSGISPLEQAAAETESAAAADSSSATSSSSSSSSSSSGSGSAGAGAGRVCDVRALLHRASVVRYTDDGRQCPRGNGGVGPGYWWTQSLKDVTVYMQLPATWTAKDLEVTVTADRLRVRYKKPLGGGQQSPPPAAVDGALYAPARWHDAQWCLEASPDVSGRPVDPTGAGAAVPGSGVLDDSWAVAALAASSTTIASASAGGSGSAADAAPAAATAAAAAPATAVAAAAAPAGPVPCKVLTISFEKATHTWWRSVCVGHPEVDATAVDSSQAVTDYDDDTQAAIRKIMFDQAAKAAGKPTSEEIAVENIMARARYAPGSPFLDQQQQPPAPEGDATGSAPRPS